MLCIQAGSRTRGEERTTRCSLAQTLGSVVNNSSQQPQAAPRANPAAGQHTTQGMELRRTCRLMAA